jgi:hypothetical protein
MPRAWGQRFTLAKSYSKSSEAARDDPSRGGQDAGELYRAPKRARAGKRGVTADTALRLAQLLKTTPQFWMHMQANFDLKAAMDRRRTLKLAKRP